MISPEARKLFEYLRSVETIPAGTIEERIIELQDKKGQLAAATLDSRAAVGSLAAEDLDYLFGE